MCPVKIMDGSRVIHFFFLSSKLISARALMIATSYPKNSNYNRFMPKMA
jgi:hypothetical protein